MSPSKCRLRLSARPALTLIEMLVATAITLLMMAAVVNLFANLTGSIRNRRAVIEVSGQLRQVRQRLALDIAGATCPAVTWQRPGDDVGYLEIIEGRYSDAVPSQLLDNDTTNGEIDYAASILPRNNLVRDYSQPPDGVDDDDAQAHLGDIDSLVPGGLGDYDDILALTVRSDDEPFVTQDRGDTVESNLAEVIWFAVENPSNGLLGEPGMRTIYRRALVIAPWRVEQRGPIDGPPGAPSPMTPEWIRYASDWYFQRYDISARYDPANNKFIPNTLSDLTRRENRAFHAVAPFPHMLASGGAGYNANASVTFTRSALDETSNPSNADATGLVNNFKGLGAYRINDGGAYDDVPRVTVSGSGAGATARPVMANVSPGVWSVAQLTFGPAPLSVHRVKNEATGEILAVNRTGEDVMLTDALAFDLRVYDPGAPLYRQPLAGAANLNDQTAAGVMLQPGDPGWVNLYGDRDRLPDSFGAYVDMGWIPLNPADYFDKTPSSEAPQMPRPIFNYPHQAGWRPPFDAKTVDHSIYPFGWPAEYDTWSLHYESDGIDQDNRDGDDNLSTGADEGTNGLNDDTINPAVDDVGERETSPPYDAPLRGIQVRSPRLPARLPPGARNLGHAQPCALTPFSPRSLTGG